MSEEDVLTAIADVLDKVSDIKEKVDEIKSLLDNDQIYIVCSDCKGSGEIYNYPDGPDDPPVYSYECPTCEGTGEYKWGKQKE